MDIVDQIRKVDMRTEPRTFGSRVGGMLATLPALANSVSPRKYAGALQCRVGFDCARLPAAVEGEPATSKHPFAVGGGVTMRGSTWHILAIPPQNTVLDAA